VTFVLDCYFPTDISYFPSFLFSSIKGISIKCWVCRSDSDPKCADPFDNSTVPITDCKQEPDLEHLPGVRPTMCRKIRQKGHHYSPVAMCYSWHPLFCFSSFPLFLLVSLTSYKISYRSFIVFFFTVNGEWRYFRSCAYMGEPGIAGDERFCLMRTGTYNIFMEYCTCNSKDGCNSSVSHRGDLLLLLIAFVAATRCAFLI